MLQQHGILEISRARLRHNLDLLRGRLGPPAPSTQLAALIKANAYGHGVEPVATLLGEEGVSWVCVYSLVEALELAAHKFKILVLAPLVLRESSPELLRAIPDWAGRQVRFTVTDAASARFLSESVKPAQRTTDWRVHIQVDTGLTRAGVAPAEAAGLAEVVAGLPGLRLEGMFAHFSHGDVPGHPTVEQQAKMLLEVALPLKQRIPGLLVHMQNSGGTFHMEREMAGAFDMVRIGIALYGLQPSGGVGGPKEQMIADLRPIARLVAPILSMHEVPAGTGVGYGHTFTTARASRLAVLPVGYADGYPRVMSNRGVVQVGGKTVPLVGRVSMDQIVADVTDVPGAKVGDMVVVVSWDAGAANSLDAMAEACGTIGYELATHFGARVYRTVVD